MEQQIVNAINDVIAMLRNVVNPIAVLAVICIGIYAVLATDPQSKRTAKGWAISIAVGLVIVNMAEKIVEFLSGIGA